MSDVRKDEDAHDAEPSDVEPDATGEGADTPVEEPVDDVATPDADANDDDAAAPATAPDDASVKAAARAVQRERNKSDAKWGTAVVIALIIMIAAFSWPDWRNEPSGGENLGEVTEAIFAQDGLVVPFEVLSVLLLAALVAAIVIAMREPNQGGG